MVTPDLALCLRGSGVNGVTIPGGGIGQRRWTGCCHTNAGNAGAKRKKTKAWRSNDEKDVSRGGARGGTVG
ncbi:hypothetical protein Tco_1387225, partial [Tanacetum coccineum]